MRHAVFFVLLATATFAFLPGRAGAGLAPGDTLWFGGTTWAADSLRWEAVPGGVWTFDSGVASAFVQPGNPPHKPAGLHRLMEGWTGWDLTAESDRPYFRRLTVAQFSGEDATCVGAPAGLGGAASLYCGVLTPEANAMAWATGRGYGNRWSVILGKTFAYPGTGDVTVEFDYANETEPDYDFTIVEVDLTGDGSAPPVVIARYDGSVSGHAALVLTQAAGRLPAAAGPFTLRFRVDSDGSYSDEDGLYATSCGAFAVDDVILSGAVTDVSSFEAGDDGWSLLPNPPGPGGDWSDVRALADLPDAPGAGCALADSVLVLYDANAGSVRPAQYTVAVSPWIDLGRANAVGEAGRVIEFDVFQDFVRPEYVGLVVLVEGRAPLGQGLPGFRIPYGCFWGPDPCLFHQGCTPPDAPRRLFVGTSALPAACEEVRIAVGVENICEVWGDCPGPNTDTTPYFDNIRFAAFDTAASVTAVGDEPLPSAALALTLGATVVRGGTVGMLLNAAVGEGARVGVFDVAGRAVRALHAGTVVGTPLALGWDLRDEAGRPVSSGVYFIRAATREAMVVRRLLVVR